MYDSPQWELIYTVANSTDSETQWTDDRGVLHRAVTLPNSMLAVAAEGWDHQVSPAWAAARGAVHPAGEGAHDSTDVCLPPWGESMQGHIPPPPPPGPQVTPITQGERMIIKMAYTTTSRKLEAFTVNLEREAYSNAY
jgi:hypothetical protein